MNSDNPVCAVHIEMVKELKANTELVKGFKDELKHMKWILVVIAGEGALKLMGWM